MTKLNVVLAVLFLQVLCTAQVFRVVPSPVNNAGRMLTLINKHYIGSDTGDCFRSLPASKQESNPNECAPPPLYVNAGEPVRFTFLRHDTIPRSDNIVWQAKRGSTCWAILDVLFGDRGNESWFATSVQRVPCQ